MKQSEIKRLLDLIEAYKKEHKRDWFRFARGFLLDYMSDRPQYEEASLVDFQEWLEEQNQ